MTSRELNDFKLYANFTKILQSIFGKFKYRKPNWKFQTEKKSAE